MLLESIFTETILTAISIGVLVAYHLQLYRQVRRDPATTAIGVTNHARRGWVQNIAGHDQGLLAVQTLRNWVMASTFMASTAILISLGLVAAAFRTEITSSAIDSLNLFGHPSATLWIIKLFTLAALFFYAFFNFTLSIRYYNHASLLINVPREFEPSGSVDAVTQVLNHGALHYTLGMRGFYLSIPLVLWLFGPLWMLCGTVLMVFVLYRLDREV